ncbi:MAG: aminotransferase class IV [Bacteroidota bacterium]|nr:aminotransferase class IV [Bacteroidota bacterium]
MYRLFETIKVVNGKLENIEYHNVRVNRSRWQLLHASAEWDLTQLIKLPELNPEQVYKCRFVYDETPGIAEFTPYSIKPLRKLTLTKCEVIIYNHKFTDRSLLERLKQNNPQYDDVIIAQNGRITDLSYANLVFWDGKSWITPSTPLLNGTKRQQYLNAGSILEREIKVLDLPHFEKLRIINAMIDLDESPDIFVKDINSYID